MRIPESMQAWFGQASKPESYAEALRLFCRPPRTELLRRERELAATGSDEWLDWNGGRVRVYRWGVPPYTVLVHGWGGRGLQLGGLVEPLQARAMGVLAVDHPGHGESDGDACTALMVAEVLHVLEKRFGRFHGAVAHSFGSIGLALAMSEGLAFERVVLLAPSADVPLRFLEFAAAVGYDEVEAAEFLQFCDGEFGSGRLDAASPVNTARALSSPCLILHDQEDREIELGQVQELAVAWPGAEFEIVQGLGHFRIIRDRKVLARVADFLSDSPPLGT